MAVLEVTDKNFETEVLKSDLPVLVDFWAEWCGPCKVIGPIVNEISEELSGKLKVAKVNVDDNLNLANRYGIQGIPAVKAFRDGEVTAEFVGVQPEATVRRFLDKLGVTRFSSSPSLETA